jgi:hypothetical protein
MAAAQREFIHAQHLDGSRTGIGQGTDQPQHRAASDADPQPAGQPRPGPAGQRQPDRFQHSAQQRGAPCIRRGQALDLLSERLRRAPGGRAEEPPDCQPDHHPLTAGRSVVEPPLVAAVHS